MEYVIGGSPYKKEIHVKHLDFTKISLIKTDRVTILEIDYSIQDNFLRNAVFKIQVNPHCIQDLRGRKPSNHGIRTRELRFSHLTPQGYCSVNYNENITFPLSERMQKELEAINEFTLILKDALGLDRKYTPEFESTPPTELDQANEKIEKLETENERLLRQNREIESKLSKIQQKFQNMIDGKDE